MSEKAYAKVNLFLSVGNKRPDGYHDVVTVMHTVNLYDEVELFPAQGLTVECDMDIPVTDNLAFKAAKAFYSYTGIAEGAHIKVIKHLPSQAGMGGGSADAAAVLRGLNNLHGAGLSAEALAKIASPLGADVPFLVYGGKGMCVGTGTEVFPMEREKLNLVIVKPDVGCPTGKMYGLLDETERTIPAYKPGLYFNSFDDVCPSQCTSAVNKLKFLGASHAMLSGSGSAVFGIFESEEDAKKAYEILKDEYSYAKVTTTI